MTLFVFKLLSPLSAGLFHRAIAESGTATLKGIVGNPLPIAKVNQVLIPFYNLCYHSGIF